MLVKSLFSGRGSLLVDDKIYFGRRLRLLSIFGIYFFEWWFSLRRWSCRFICFKQDFFCFSGILTWFVNLIRVWRDRSFSLMLRLVIGFPFKGSLLVNHLGNFDWSLSFLLSQEILNCLLKFAEWLVESIWLLYFLPCSLLLLLAVLVDLSY